MSGPRLTTIVLLWCVLCPAAPSMAGAQDQRPEGQLDFYGQEPALRDYVDQALRANPAIRQALARYRAALQRVPQVTALPDPVLSFGQAIRSVETRVGSQLNTYALSQAFPWFGTLDLQGKVAVQAATAEYQLYVAQQRELVAQVKEAFYNLGFVDVALGITEEEQSLLEHYEQLAQIRYATGQGLQQAVIKIQAEITRVLNDLKIFHQQRLTLAARLNTLMDRVTHRSVEPVGPLMLPQVPLDLDELYALGDQHLPELRAATALIERSERSIALARKNYWPNFTIGAGYVNVGGRSDPAGRLQPPPDEGKNALSLFVGMTIPIRRDKYRAGVQQAAEELVAQRHNYANIRNGMEFSIRDQVIRLQTLQEQIRLFEDALIPQAEETLRATEAAYETGQLGVLDLLDSERVLLNVRLVNARYYSDYLAALARLERAIGARYPR